MKRNIHLHGNLAKQFGSGPWQLEADTPSSCVKGLCANNPGLKPLIRQGNYHFVTDSIKPDNSYSEEAVQGGFSLSDADDVHIIPAVEGSANEGLKIVAGVALLGIATAGAAGVFGGAAAASGGSTFAFGAEVALGVTWGNIAMVGAGLALQGVSSMLSPTPELGDAMGAESPEERPSFMFNGPVNVQEQGGAIPLVFGRALTGSTVISAGIRIEQLETE